jgi:F-type H+-transporting ATPase subunit epsilon
MSKKFSLELNTPEATLYNDQAEVVSFMTPEGEMSIMADHTPLLCIVSPGVIVIKNGDQEKILSSGGGFLEAATSGVKAYIQSAEFAESIDEQRAIEAKQKAEIAMASHEDEMSLADATSLLERNIARLKTLDRKKRKSI